MTYADEVLADAPLGLWMLDETTGSTAVDSSGNGNDGTYVGAPALASTTLANLGPSPTFIDDYVTLPAINVGTGPYTIEAVARADSIVDQSEIIAEIYSYGSPTIVAGIGLNLDSILAPETMMAGTYTGGSGSPGYSWLTIAGDPWTVGDTHHLVFTYDGTDARFYVDGVLVGTLARTPFASNNGWRIGGRYNAVGAWDGSIAGVAIYDTCLDAGRVADHYDTLTGPGTAAVTFTATGTLSITPEPDPTLAAVTFTATVTFTIDTPLPPAPATASISFTASATLDVVTRPVGVRRRLVVVDIHGTPFGELDNAVVGAISYTLNEPSGEDFSFTLPVSDPKAHLLLDEKFREVQVWRGDQLLAWGPMVRPAADKNNLAVSCKGVAWYLTRRTIGKASRRNYILGGDFEAGLVPEWRVGALSLFESLATRGPENWSATVTTERAVTGTHSLRLEQFAPGIPEFGVTASQSFVWEVDPAVRDGDEWSLVAYCYIPSVSWHGPPPEGVGLQLDRFSAVETVSGQPSGGGPVETLPAPIESDRADIDENTPRDVWVPMRVTLTSPVTSQPEFVGVTLGCPNGGVIYWDRVTLSSAEAERFYAVDQADIAASVLAHLQDPLYGKSDLNIDADMPATGVLRDRTYLHSEHLVGADVLAELTTLDDGLDFSVAYTATTRTLRSHHPARGVHRAGFTVELGRNTADFAWTLDGENAASTVVVLGTGDGSAREESSATDPSAYSEGLTLETVFSAPPATPIDSLDDLARAELTVTTAPDLLSVTLTSPQAGQRDPLGILWPGDTVPVNLAAGALSVTGTYRVVQLVITPDDTLELTLNRQAP